MKTAGLVPEISRPLRRFFGKYATGYLRRHFHTVRLLKGAEPPNDQLKAQVVFLNHAAWWDPLVCLLLAEEFFPGRPTYAPMAAAALQRYSFFKRLGFFSVETGTVRGAANFLRTSAAILAQPGNMLFLTPQGEFADVRALLVFAPGLERLAARMPEVQFLPLAIEYTFWEERKPEVLLAFGAAGTDQLGPAQARLAAAAQRRQPNEWQVLLRAKSGVNWPYDLWRWTRARLRGERSASEHSRL